MQTLHLSDLILEYASVIWTPFYIVHIDSLERIPQGFPHNDLIERVNMLNLAKWRDLHAAVFLDNLIRGKINCRWCDIFNKWGNRLDIFNCSVSELIKLLYEPEILKLQIKKGSEICNKCNIC